MGDRPPPFALVALPCPSSPGGYARPIAVAATNQSFNWSEYMQGRLENGTTFHSIAAAWILPTATPHRQGEAEYSSSWIGIGGGCLDTACTLTDVTLIQAGIGQDIDAAGNTYYYAWWETIRAPLDRTTLPVRAGDRVGVAIFENSLPEIWTIVLVNVTTRGVFTITAPYPSTYGSAEWVIETPVVISETGAVSVGPMPDLSVVRFRLRKGQRSLRGIRPRGADRARRFRPRAHRQAIAPRCSGRRLQRLHVHHELPHALDLRILPP